MREVQDVKRDCVVVCRAGSAQPVAYDNDGESDSEGNHERHQAGEAGGSQHKGPAGLMGQVYNRKLEQAQQVVGLVSVLAQPTASDGKAV